MDKNHTKMIATGGILLALSVITLSGATMIPGIELTLFALSSAFVSIILIEFKHGAGWLFYIATVILSYAVSPNKAGLLPYTFFFGVYPIIKFYIERTRKLPQLAEILIKLVFSNAMFAAGFLLFGKLFTGSINLPDLAVPLIVIGAQLFFLVYDYILTLIIGFYLARRPKS